MRFVFGPIPESRVLDPEADGWTPLRELGPQRYMLSACLLSLPFVAAANWILFSSLDTFRSAVRSGPAGALLFVGPLLLMIPVHECIHAAACMKGFRSRHLIVGFWLAHALPYVVCDSPMRRNRLLLMVAAPFLVLSVAPLAALPFLAPEGRDHLLFFVLLHAAACSGDALVFWRVARIPSEAWLLNKGWVTYWTRTRARDPLQP